MVQKAQVVLVVLVDIMVLLFRAVLESLVVLVDLGDQVVLEGREELVGLVAQMGPKHQVDQEIQEVFHIFSCYILVLIHVSR